MKNSKRVNELIIEISEQYFIVEGQITDLITRETLENMNEKSQPKIGAIAIGSAILGQIGTATIANLAVSDEGIDVSIFALELTDIHGDKHYLKGCFPEVIFKNGDQVKVIVQPLNQSYALAKAVIDIKNNYIWTGQEVVRGRMQYRLWAIKLIVYCLIVTFIFLIILDFFMSGRTHFTLFSDIGIVITSVIIILIFLVIGWKVGSSFDEQSIELEAILLKLGFNKPTMANLYNFSVFNVKNKNKEEITGYSTRWADYTYRIDLAQQADKEKYGKSAK
ncbi:MAG: putative type VI secretion system effector [Acinetobacter sp.]